MKPTDKQVVEWARKARVDNAWDINWFDPYYARFAALAYEAGRKDENEACADIAENWRCNGMPRYGVAEAIRARGQE